MKKNLLEDKILLLDQRQVTLKVVRSARRKKSVAMIVRSPAEIVIQAPQRTQLNEIDEFINHQKNWLLKKIKELEQRELLKIEQLKLVDHTEYTKKQILEKFIDRAEFWCQKLNVQFKKIQLSNAKKRWGSCSVENIIRINSALIKAPLDLLDYVIVHELCHIKHKNHSPAFWHFVASVMPEYKEHRKKLRAIADILV